MSLDFPETEADEEAESRFKEWQGVLTEWEARDRYVDHNRAESTFISARHQLNKKIVQDFFSRLDGPTTSSDEFEFGYHALDCYAVTPKDEFHGGRPCVLWKDHSGECVCNKVAWREAWKSRPDHRFEIHEIMHECEDSEYSAERAKVLYKKFDKFVFPESATLKRRDCYKKAQDLLRLLVPAPHKFELPPAGD